MTIPLIYPDIVNQGCIEIYNKIFQRPDEVINDIEKEVRINNILKWSRAETLNYSGQQSIDDLRTNYEICITKYAEQGERFCQILHNKIANLLVPVCESYLYRHRLLGIPYHFEWFNVLKYEEGNYFDPHVDGLPGNPRFLTCIVYLNNDYLGGELEFLNMNLKIKPDSGSMLIFPAAFSHCHMAHKILKGTKYAIVSWLKYGEMP